MVVLSEIHEEIVKAIKYSGLTQKEIADKLFIKQQTVSEYVKGSSYPALDTFANLCRELDLDANEILCIK